MDKDNVGRFGEQETERERSRCDGTTKRQHFNG